MRISLTITSALTEFQPCAIIPMAQDHVSLAPFRIQAMFITQEAKVVSKEDRQQVYIGWLRQAASRTAVAEESYDHAWEVARAAARLLRERYAVNRVRAFGSLVHKARFHPGSDIDLAVEGLEPTDYWEAVTSVLFLDDQVSVILIDQAACRPEIWEAVEREGVDL